MHGTKYVAKKPSTRSFHTVAGPQAQRFRERRARRHYKRDCMAVVGRCRSPWSNRRTTVSQWKL